MSKDAQAQQQTWRFRVPCPCKCGGTVAVHASLYKGRRVDVDMFLVFDEDKGEGPPASHRAEILLAYNLGTELGLEIPRRYLNTSSD